MVRIMFLLLVGIPSLALTAQAYTCSVTGAAAPLNFGNLDPAIGSDIVMTTVVTVRCTGAGTNPVSFEVTDDDGLYETGPGANRMLNASYPGEYLPYSFTYPTPLSGNKGQAISLTITGTVLGAVYQNASLGVYADTVTITILP